MTTKFKIWGLEIEEIITDGYLIWLTQIRNPFFKDGKPIIGLNEKFLKVANQRGVSEIKIKVGQKEISLRPPSLKDLKNIEYEKKPSLFASSPPLKIYHFPINHK